MDETWETIIEKNKKVRNYYNECIFHLYHKLNSNITYDIVFRCYNDGFAYRYIINDFKNDSISLNAELTNIRFKDDFSYWAYNDKREDVGSLKRSKSPESSIKTSIILE